MEVRPSGSGAPSLPACANQRCCAEVAGGPERGQRLTTKRELSRDVTASVRETRCAVAHHARRVLLSAVALMTAERTGRDDVLCGIAVSGRPATSPTPTRSSARS
jgi:hypothetical protein